MKRVLKPTESNVLNMFATHPPSDTKLTAIGNYQQHKPNTLLLAEFSPTPWLDFGTMECGGRYFCQLQVHNPSRITNSLTVERISTTRGVGIQGIQDSEIESFRVLVGAGESTTVTIRWAPEQVGILRDNIQWKCNGMYRLETVLNGVADGERDYMCESVGERRAKRAFEFDNGDDFSEGCDVGEKRQRRNNEKKYLVSTQQAEADWEAFERRAFIDWLNFHLQPRTTHNQPSSTLHIHTCTDVQKFTSSPLPVSTNSKTTNRAINTTFLEMDHIQAEADHLRNLREIMKSDKVYIHMHQSINCLLSKGTMMLKPDHTSSFDPNSVVSPQYTTSHVHLSWVLVEVLLDVYSREWLCRALHVIVGRPVSRKQCKGKAFEVILRKYIEAHMLCRSCAPYQVACKTLAKLLSLIFLLDRAGENGRTTRRELACVFKRESLVKSTNGVLKRISHDLLYGQGDIVRQLRILDVETSYTQTAKDEYDFSVTATEVQLCDGVRLARLSEVLFNSEGVVLKCTVPASTQAMQCENVTLALGELQKNIPGLLSLADDTITPMDIVTGHKERTEALVWRLMFHCNAQTALNVRDVQSEIQRCVLDLRNKKGRDFPLQLSESQPSKRATLLRWCDAVARHFDLTVTEGEQAIESFRDGRVLCSLISYYHPFLLPHSEVKQDVKDDDLNKVGNVRHNFRLVANAVSQLGGVAPVCLAGLTDNEDDMLSFVSHLCVRMIILGRKAKAALVIQKRYRHYRLFSTTHVHKRRVHQIKSIQTIERFWLRCKIKQITIHTKAFDTIARFIFSVAVRKRHYKRIRACALITNMIIGWGHVRGIIVRKQQGPVSSELLLKMRLSRQRALRHPSKTLGHITDKALVHLAKGGSSEKKMTNLVKACEHLEMTTKLSRECQMQLTHNGGVQSMIRFMKGCDRTVSNQRALSLILTMMHRLADGHVTAADLMDNSNEVVVALVDVIQNFRDIGSLISQSSLVLLTLVQASPVYLNRMRQMKPVISRAQAVYTLAKRKEAMVSRARQYLPVDAVDDGNDGSLPGYLGPLDELLNLLKE
eukprot:CFRG4478T1